MKNILYVSCVIIATVIGAGFATGQELLSYFNIYGAEGAIGLTAAMLMLMGCTWCVLLYVAEKREPELSGYLREAGGAASEKIYAFCIRVFSFCGFCAMCAAFSKLMGELFGAPYFLCVALFSLLCIVVSYFGSDWICVLNLIIAPILMVGLILISVKGMSDRAIETFAVSGARHHRFFMSAVVYASYNVLSVISILFGLKKYVPSKKIVNISVILSAVLMLAISGSVFLCIEVYFGKIVLGEIPLLTIALRHEAVYHIIYTVVVTGAIFSTAISLGYASLRKRGRQRLKEASLIWCMSIPVCLMGFENIVKKVYGAFGYLGIPLMILILCFFVKQHKK